MAGALDAWPAVLVMVSDNGSISKIGSSIGCDGWSYGMSRKYFRRRSKKYPAFAGIMEEML